MKRRSVFLSLSVVLLLAVSAIAYASIVVPNVFVSGQPANAADVNANFQFLADRVVPAGAVMSFELTACPTGWAELVSARGRVIVGLNSGGELSKTRGVLLANDASRTITDVPSHNHDVDPPTSSTPNGASHGHIYAITTAARGGTPTLAADAGGGGTIKTLSTAIGGEHSHTVDIPSFSSANTGVSSVDVTMPYVQLLTCKKT